VNISAGNGGAGIGGAAGIGGTSTGGISGTVGGAGMTTGGGAGTVGGAGMTTGGGAGAVGGAGLPNGGGSGAAGSGGAGVGGAGNGGSGSGGTAGQGNGGFTITSPAFRNVEGCSVDNPSVCEVFPDENVSYMERANISPELRWTGVPSGTRSFAIVLMDASFGQAHWVIWNIPASVTMLAANVAKDTAMPAVPAGSRQANANFATEEEHGYFGPHLPCNVFEFQIYALASDTFSPMDPESSVLVSIELQELGDPVLGLAKLTGRSNDYMMTCD
jgi:Raf kinase inhibitor-like YbhB/YbcL family protein